MMPAIDFPLYGLDETWRRARWLQMVDGQPGQPTWGVWLGHGTTETLAVGEPWAVVGSLPEQRHAEAMTVAGGDPVREVAYEGMVKLVNLTLPDPETADAEPDLPALGALMQDAADAHEQWTRVPWRVDGRSITARVHEWAGAWLGFTTDLPVVQVCVVASALPADLVALSKVADSGDYHFDSTRPIDFAGTLTASAAAAFADVRP